MVKHLKLSLLLLLWCAGGGPLFSTAYGQESLSESLKEEEEYYNNFGISGYSKKEIERQVIPYYDNFGRHIVNGYLIYGLETERNTYFDSDGNIKFRDPASGLETGDSTVNAYSNMFQTSLVSENFNNLIMTQDGLGDMKSVFLIGSQIQTRFTPLTMNKLNFQGVRWDIWTPALKFTTLISRTRPFVMSQNDRSGRSYIGYYREDMRNWQGMVSDELLPDDEYITKNWGMTAFTDQGWNLQYDKYSDYSNKSIYGDYDILWGLHGKTNIANIVDLGVTYLNHHRSDIKKGEDIFSGDVPNDYIPTEIHFEFYDMTPNTTDDPGVYVDNVTMTMNGEDLGADGEGATYLVREDLRLVSSNLPVERSGNSPIIVAFNTSSAARRHFGDSTKVKRIDFSFTVSGNYLVFVSTDKMVAYGYAGQRNDQTQVVQLDQPFTRSITGTYQTQQSGTWSPYEDVSLSGWGDVRAITGPLHGRDFKQFGNSWFGDYIAKSPRVIYATGTGKTAVYQANKRTYSYTYSINCGSVTYGIDFKGKVLGVSFSGEVAVNSKDYIYPGGDRFDPVYRTAAYLKYDRDILKNLLMLRGMFYNVDPEYDPALEIPLVSQHFSYSRLYDRNHNKYDYDIPDYLWYPQHFNNNFHMLDDNDDDDLYIESDRMIYPGDLGSGSASTRWAADGTFASFKASARENERNNRKANYTYLPNGLYAFYGDDDGVYVDQYDRNHNGIVDYKEDFLLYEKDPPIFSLDNDMDNNGVWDVEDDDPYPDLPKGIKASYVLTSNGWKSQGIRGANTKLIYTPVKNLEISASALYEKAIDLDFSRASDTSVDQPSLIGNGSIGYDNGTSVAEDFSDRRSFELKGSAMLNVVKRSLGLAYFTGGEVQYLRDNIRNDVIRLQEVEDIEYLYQDYYYQTDELRYRNAVVSNAIGGVTYNNIPNFVYSASLALGLEKRMGLDGNFYTMRTLRNQALDTTQYEFRWEPYTASMLKRLYLVNKFDYSINFNVDFSNRMRFLNFLNRLSFNPQFKVSWSYSSSDANDDPRDSFNALTRLGDEDSTNLRLDWARYRRDNTNEFSSTPILRCYFKVAEKTMLQYGVQWKKSFDRLIRAESDSRRVQTFQMLSTDNVSGYNVTLILGMNLVNNDYDVLNYDTVFQTGHLFDGKDTQFFIKVYAGN